MFDRLIKRLAKKHIAEAVNLALCSDQQRRNEESDKINSFQYYEQLGSIVIYTSNEWTDLVIGTVIRIDHITQNNCPVLIIDDILSSEERMILTHQVYPFSREMREAILKLNPWERWNLKSLNSPVPWNKPKQSSQLLTNSEILNMLKY